MNRRLPAIVAALLALAILVLAAASCDGNGGAESDRAVGGLTDGAAPIAGVVVTDVSELVKTVRNGVVSVSQARFEVEIRDILQTTLVPQGVGTGIVIDDQGHILTNFHVIQGAQAVVITSPDGIRRAAQIVGEAPDFDLALLRVEDPTGLTPLPLGRSGALEVGDPVIAIGNALGLDATAPTVSVGIVSATGRTIEPEGGGVLQGLLQTDAAINPGNSGGPLLNAAGQVVGINTLGGNAQNVGFAIAIDDARELIEQFLAGRGGAYLGVQLGDNSPQRAAQFRLGTDSGALVLSVTAGSGSTSGLRPGDVVVEAAGRTIEGRDDFAAVIDASTPGDRLALVIVREGERQPVTVTVGERPVRVGG